MSVNNTRLKTTAIRLYMPRLYLERVWVQFKRWRFFPPKCTLELKKQ